MVLGDVYPEDTMPKPKINPALFTNNTGSLRRLSESLKVALVQSELSAKGILTSGCYKPPELMEDLLRDFNKYGVYFKEPNTPFLNSRSRFIKPANNTDTIILLLYYIY